MYRFSNNFNKIIYKIPKKYSYYNSKLLTQNNVRYITSIPPIPPNNSKKEIRKNLILKYWDKTKKMTHQYGWVFLGTYWGFWLGITYGYYEALDLGWLSYQDWKWLHLPKIHQEYYSWGEKMGFNMSNYPINPQSEKLLIALMLGKITKIIYLPLSIVITPSISRLIGIVPQDSKKTIPQIKERIDEIKEEVKNDINQAL